MGEVLFAGRILFAGIFLYSAVIHLTQTTALARVAQSKRVPFPRVATILGGILLLLGSTSLILGVWADLGALLLALFLIPTAAYMHAFWHEEGEAKNQEITQFLKDIALAGAAILVATLIASSGQNAGLMLTDPLFRTR